MPGRFGTPKSDCWNAHANDTEHSHCQLIRLFRVRFTHQRLVFQGDGTHNMSPLVVERSRLLAATPDARLNDKRGANYEEERCNEVPAVNFG